MTYQQTLLSKRRKVMKGNKGNWALCMITTFDILSDIPAFACFCIK